MRREHWYNCIKISVESDDDLYKIGVVPYAGTWIETQNLASFPKATARSFPTRERGLKQAIQKKYITLPLSFPTRERGLKQITAALLILIAQVVPYAGTWIETAMTNIGDPCSLSFPTRERGLKPLRGGELLAASLSFPTRERGLKLN